MGLLKFALILAMAMIATSASASKVYKIVDEKTGRVTFTDKPPADISVKAIEQEELPVINTQPAQALPAKAPETEQQATTGYQVFKVSQPTDKTTIPPGQIDLIIQLHVVPQLQDGHLIQLFYDGKAFSKPATATSFKIDQLYRGSHTISASIIDTNGKVISKAPPITIYVHRASKILNNPTPAPTPTPK